MDGRREALRRPPARSAPASSRCRVCDAREGPHRRHRRRPSAGHGRRDVHRQALLQLTLSPLLRRQQGDRGECSARQWRRRARAVRSDRHVAMLTPRGGRLIFSGLPISEGIFGLVSSPGLLTSGQLI